MKSRRWMVIPVVLLGLAMACQMQTPMGPIRATTSPPSLEYMPPEEIRSAMWVLAAEIQHLENLLTVPAAERSESTRTAVATTLERMRVAALTLDRPGRTSQHPVLDQNLERFVLRLERARRAVDRDPPSYFQASSVAGACFLCHGRTTETARVPGTSAQPLGAS